MREKLELKMEPIAVSAATAAQLLGVSTPTVYEWMNTEGFPNFKINGCRRIPVRELREWAAEQARGGEKA